MDIEDVDFISYAILILEKHEEACDEVSNESLGAKSDSDSEHTGRGDQGSKIHPRFTQDRARSDQGNQGVGDALEDRPCGVGSFALTREGSVLAWDQVCVGDPTHRPRDGSDRE